MLLRMDSLSQLLLYNACEPLCNGVHLVLARKRHRDSEEQIRSQIRCTMRQYGHCDGTELVVVSYHSCFSMTNIVETSSSSLTLRLLSPAASDGQSTSVHEIMLESCPVHFINFALRDSPMPFFLLRYLRNTTTGTAIVSVTLERVSVKPWRRIDT